GLPLVGTPAAYALPEPQQQGQAETVINGTVLDENNEPVIGASVVQKGNKANAVATDAFGHFKIRVAAGTQLEISYVGYQTMIMKASPDMMAYLQPTTEMLNELVAIGYGTQKKANLTGAVATVDVARTMDSRTTGDVAKALQGSVPGLTITTGDGAINTTSNIKIRGLGTLSNSQVSNPLIIVDGVEVSDLSYVNPEEIQEISVLKDAASSAIYGTRAAFGVILITTKTPNKADRVSVKYTNNFAWSQATTLPSYSNVPSQIEALAQANHRQGVQNELFGMDLDDMLPYAQAWYEQNGRKNTGYREMRPFQSMSDVGDYYQDPNTGATMFYADWDVAGIMFNNAAPSQKHNVSVEGNSGKTAYRLAFGYDGRQGLMTYAPNKMQRYNVNANVQTEIFSWLKAGARFTFARKEYEGPNLWGSGGNYTMIWRWGSYFGPYGSRLDPETGEYVDYRNIITRTQAGDYYDVADNTRMQAWLDATLAKGLTLHADFSYDIQNYNVDQSYLPIYGWNNWSNSATKPEYMVTSASSYAYQGNSRTNYWSTNVYATYDKTFAQDHNLKVMLGGMADRKYYNTFAAQKNVLGDLSLPYLGLATGGSEGTNQSISNTITTRASAGFFGRINYDYKGKYLFEANGRYDGSSSFPANDQWAFFPSVSAGWRFSEENFMKPLSWWSNGKLRASYGHIGNEAVGSYRFISTISRIASGSSYWVNSGGTKVSQFGTPSLVSSSLTWERIVTTDIGLDLGFLNNSLNVSFDWFQRDTKDMLAPGSTAPAVLGASAPYQNAGSMRTRGWELAVNWNHSFGDWDVYANANIYDGKTVVTDYNNPSGLLSSFYDGKVYGDIWGFETDRYFEESDFTGKDDVTGAWIYANGVADQTGLQQGSFVYGPGDIKFKDLNGDGVIDGGSGTLEDHGDLKVIGNSAPRYEYSFRLGGSWKGFDLDVYFQGVGKRDMWFVSAFVTPLARGADATYSNQESYNKLIFDDAWNVIGYDINQNNDYPVMFAGSANSGTVSGIAQGRYNFYPQSKYLMNMAYLRLKALTIGYTLPYDITKKALIQKARIYFSADNLCLLYNGMRKYPIDPEIGSNWTTNSAYSNGTFGRTDPMTRSFSFGLQVTF
ncbi:MAG: TonB-dependent receptor, partial [Bacteroidales bacterium]|nr:TonB-dependent receptor [Bacteroidales bacterium]